MLFDRKNMLLNPRTAVLFASGTALLLFAIYQITLYREDVSVSVGGDTSGNHLSTTPQESPRPTPPKPPTLEETIQQLFEPIKHKDFMAPFTDPTGTVYKHDTNIWKEPLGKDLLIVDVDTRYPEQMFDPKKRVDWEHMDAGDSKSLGTESVFNHYLYATIHGYDYKYYRPDPVPDHHMTWPKVHSMFNLLPQYKFVVFLDADASFRHLQLPFEWLLNRWNVTHNTSFTMARDPLDDDCNLCDSNGIAMVNTGFVVAQNLPYTNKIFDVWMKCTGGKTKYGDGCAKWKGAWAHEQAVFSDYLRYDYNPDGDNIRELNCGEANGFPGHGWYDPVDCNGKFVRHHTFVKHMTKETTANSVMQAFVDIVKANFAKKGSQIVVSEQEQKQRLKAEEQRKQQQEKEEQRKKLEQEQKDEQVKKEGSAKRGIWHEPPTRREES